MKNEYQIIEKLLLTEKGMLLSEAAPHRKYTFKVDARANKLEIKQAVEKIFGVNVLKVNTLTRRGKKKRERTANFGYTSNWKRAVVTLAEGDMIQTN